MEIRMKEHKTPVLGNSVGALSSMKGRAVGRVRFGYFSDKARRVAAVTAVLTGALVLLPFVVGA